MNPRQSNHRQRGTALIEFALVFPFLLALTFVVVDFGRAFFQKNMLHQAAREGVRTLAVETMADSADAAGRVSQVMAAAKIPVTSISYLGPINRQVGVRVQTEMKWLFPGLLNWMGAKIPSSSTLTAEAWMRKETP